MVPLLVPADEWSRLEEGLDSADAAAQSDPARSARSAAAPAERTAAAVAGAGESGVSPPLPRHSCAARHLPAHARRRPGAIAGWSVGGACRSDAGAVGRRATRSKTGSCCCTACPEAFRGCQIHRLASFFRAQRDTSERADADSGPARQGRAADAGTVQRDVLRTCVPGAVPRLHAGRRRRPDRARSPRVHQDARRPSAGRRHLPAARRQLLRSARAARRLVPRRRRAWSTPSAPATSSSPTRSGSGVIETAAILPFLPALCRELLGEELMLPSVPTWWCGRAAASVVRARASGRPGRQAGVPLEGTGAGVRATAHRARKTRSWRRPFARSPRTLSRRRTWQLSSAPVWHRHRLEPRAVVLQDVRGRGRRFIRGDAWRPDARVEHAGSADRLDAARRQKQGHVGALTTVR